MRAWQLLLDVGLALDKVGHLGGWGAGQTEVDLDWVVDEPLQSGQGTDHDDPWAKSFPHSYIKHKKSSVLHWIFISKFQSLVNLWNMLRIFHWKLSGRYGLLLIFLVIPPVARKLPNQSPLTEFSSLKPH